MSTAPTILIADDNPTNLNVLFEYLSAQGYRVLIAEDGAGAIEQAQYGQPDLILLDVIMPGLDGFQTCEKLKQSDKTRDIPVIFMTAISETTYVLKGFSVGAVDYLTKPLQREEVLVRVRNHISIRALQRELKEEIAVRQKVEKELREINAGKDIFFSILAHDLKNPVGGLLSLSEALVEILSADADEAVRDIALDILTTSRQVGDLLLDLLNWAQMQLGKLEPAYERVSINKEVEIPIALIDVAARTKKIEIINDITEPIEIYCDLQMNATVLRNLLGNAVKFTPTGGTIRISAEKKNDLLIISVSDSGKGISAELLPGLFRLGENKTTFGTAGEKGTGLGLPLSREMVEKNGGQIWVDSPGLGAIFHFSVPLSK